MLLQVLLAHHDKVRVGKALVGKVDMVVVGKVDMVVAGKDRAGRVVVGRVVVGMVGSMVVDKAPELVRDSNFVSDDILMH